MTDIGFKKLSSSVALILATVVSSLTIGLFVGIQNFGYELLEKYGISGFLESTYFSFKVFAIIIINIIIGLLISYFSLHKVVDNDLMSSLKGE